jgi:ribosomal protein S3
VVIEILLSAILVYFILVFPSHIFNGLCLGGKIKISGRLDGVAFSRSLWIIVGEVSTQTLRRAIDYAQGSALTKDGQIGIKVWITQLKDPTLR